VADSQLGHIAALTCNRKKSDGGAALLGEQQVKLRIEGDHIGIAWKSGSYIDIDEELSICPALA